MTQKQVNELANKALLMGNPYIKKSIQFFIDRAEHYIYADRVMTREQLDEAYLETARKDIKQGYNERKVGYYDKWFRYNHADEGRAYDLGQRFAVDNVKCPDYLNFIE